MANKANASMGTNLSYSMTLDNLAAGASSGGVTIGLLVPVGLQVTSVSGLNGFSCSPSTTTGTGVGFIACSRSDSVAANAKGIGIANFNAVKTVAPGVTVMAAITQGDSSCVATVARCYSEYLVGAGPQLSVINTADKTQARVGDAIKYSLQLTNTTTQASDTAAMVSYSLPAGLKVSSISPATGFSCSPSSTDGSVDAVISCGSSNPIAAGTSPQVASINTTLSKTLSTFSTTATLAAGDGECLLADPKPSRCLSTTSLTLSEVGQMKIRQVTDKTAVPVGETFNLTYYLSSANTAESATPVAFDVVIPNGLEVTSDGLSFFNMFNACTAANNNWVGPTVLSCTSTSAFPANQAQELKALAVNLKLSATTDVSSSAKITAGDSSCSDAANAARCSSSVTIAAINPPALSLTGTADKTNVAVGEVVTYSYKVTNAGLGAAANPAFTVNVPAGLTMTSALVGNGFNCAPASGKTWVSPTSVVCSISSIAAGATSPAVTMPLQKTSTSTETIGAFVSSGDNSCAANNAAVTGAPARCSTTGNVSTTFGQLAIAVVSEKASAGAGDAYTYFAKITNPSAIASAAPVSFTVNMPAGLSRQGEANYAGFTCASSGGANWVGPATITCTRSTAIGANTAQFTAAAFTVKKTVATSLSVEGKLTGGDGSCTAAGTDPRCTSTAAVSPRNANTGVAVLNCDPICIDDAKGLQKLARLPAKSWHEYLDNGTARPIRNDLADGYLQGEVRLAQSHTTNPRGNRNAKLPNIVPYRQTKLFFTPIEKNLKDPITIDVYDSETSAITASFKLDPPEYVPASDYFDSHVGLSDIAYSRSAHSVTLPWQLVKPTMKIHFSAGQYAGVLRKIEFGQPTEFTLHAMRFGILAPIQTDPYSWAKTRPVQFATEYYETLPITKLTLATTEDYTLSEFMTRDGAWVTGQAASTGSTYFGVLREIADEISQAVLRANEGLIDLPASLQAGQMGASAHIAAQRSAIQAWGKYSNGVVQHGMIAIGHAGHLTVTVDNEVSHELGHTYNLWHGAGQNAVIDGVTYPDGQRHNQASGWGYLGRTNRMRSPFWWHWTTTRNDFAPVPGLGYNADSMSGGGAGPDIYYHAYDPSSELINNFTHYTGFAAQIIQDTMDGYGTVAAGFPSGTKRMDLTTNKYIDHMSVVHPDWGNVGARIAEVGVPIVTIFGRYNAGNANNNWIFPAIKGNYGNTYNYPLDSGSGDACFVQVRYNNGNSQNIAIPWESTQTRSFSINIARSWQPIAAQTFCRYGGVNHSLSGRTIALDTAAITPPVKVGADSGYEAMNNLEYQTLRNELDAMNNSLKPISIESMAVLERMTSAEKTAALGTTQRFYADLIMAVQDSFTIIEAYAYKNASLAPATLKANIKNYLNLAFAKLGFGVQGLDLPTGVIMKSSFAMCPYLDNITAAVPTLWAASGACATVEARGRWWMDMDGKIHNEARPDICFDGGTHGASVVGRACDSANPRQRFIQGADGTLFNARVGAMLGGVKVDIAANGQVWANEQWGHAYTKLPVSNQIIWRLVPKEVVKWLAP